MLAMRDSLHLIFVVKEKIVYRKDILIGSPFFDNNRHSLECVLFSLLYQAVEG